MSGTLYDIDLAIKKDFLPQFINLVKRSGSDDLIEWLASTKGRFTPDALLTVKSSEFDHVLSEALVMLGCFGDESFQLAKIETFPEGRDFSEMFGEDYSAGEYDIQLKSLTEYDAALWVAATDGQRNEMIDAVLKNRDEWAFNAGNELLPKEMYYGVKLIMLESKDLTSAMSTIPMLKAIDSQVHHKLRIFDAEIEKLIDPQVNMKLQLAERLEQIESSSMAMR